MLVATLIESTGTRVPRRSEPVHRIRAGYDRARTWIPVFQFARWQLRARILLPWAENYLA